MHEWMEVSTKYGRTEIVNNLRTTRIARKLGLRGVRSCSCSGIDLLSCFELPSEKAPGECEVGDTCGDAPWYDLNFPQSMDFAGFLSTSVMGFDSSFERDTTPLPFSGQSIGSRTETGKCITYEGYLVSRTKKGMEYGLSYYSELLRTVGECGKFTLWSAVDCPDSDACKDIQDVVRFLPLSYVTGGPKVIETKTTRCGDSYCGHGAYYAQIQFSICSEQSYIYTLPQKCIDNEKHQVDKCDCGILWTEARYTTKVEETTLPRPVYQLQIRSDRSVCKVGGWEWEDTQLGGGIGIVEIIQPDTSTTDATSSGTSTSDTKCSPLRTISARYDCTQVGQISFTTDNWAYPDWQSNPTGIPCDVQISNYWKYDPGDQVSNPDGTVSGTAPSWTTSTSGSSGDGCCLASIQWVSSTEGVIIPIADPADPWSIPYDPTRVLPSGECDWPPSGCKLQIISAPCKEDGITVEDCKDVTQCPIIVDPSTELWELETHKPVQQSQTVSYTKVTGTQGNSSSSSSGVTGLPPVRETCNASYYTDRAVLAFNGKYRSDNGAAHKTLPGGTEVWVSYQGKTVKVVIDDRGPYIDGRCIDLQENEFAQLAPLSQGVIPGVELRWW